MKLGGLYKALLGWQNYADDEMAEHLFYCDVGPYAADELTEEYWPVPVGEEIVPMRLPIDSDGLYGEAVDDAYTGDPDNPTHSYTASYHGPVMLRLSDNDGSEMTCTVYVDVDII